MASDGTVKIGTDLDQSGLKKGLQGLGGFAIGSAATATAKTSLAAIGGMVTAISGASVAAYKFGTEYETSAAKVSTIADTSKISMENLGKAVMQLSTDTGESAAGLNEALYSAISAGADTASAVDLVGVAVKAARGGFTDTETAVDGLTSALNAYGMETTDAEGLANKFLVTQNLGKTTFGELASSIGGVAPTAHAAGVSIDELLSGVASLTANGVGTSEAMTGIKAALSNVIKPSSEAAKMAEQLGLDFSTAALQSKGFAGFLDDVKTATGGNMDQMAKLFGSVEALNTVLTLTSDQGGELMNKTLDEMSTNTTALDDAYEAMSNTAQVHVQKIGNSFKNLGIQIYQDNKGPVAEFTGLLSDAAEDIMSAYQDSGFSGLSNQIGKSLADIGIKVAGEAPKLIEAGADMLQQFLNGIIQNIPDLASAGTGIVTSVAKGVLQGASSMMSAGIQLLTNMLQGLRSKMPEILQAGYQAISLILTSIQSNLPLMITYGLEILQSLIAGIIQYLPNLLPVVQQIFTNLITTITENLPTLLEMGVQMLVVLAQGIAEQLPALVPVAVNAILTLVQSLIDNIDTVIDAGIQILLALAQGIVESLPQLIEQVPVIINAFWDAFDRNLGTILEAGWQLILTLGKGIIDNIPVIIDNAGEIVKAIFNTITHLDMLSMGKNLITNLGKGIKSIGGAIRDAAKGILNHIKAPFENFSFTNIGRNIVQGIINGITSLGSHIGSVLQNIVSNAVDGILSFLGIHSPSRLMRDLIGKNMVAGIGVGFELESDNLDKQAKETVQNAADTMKAVNAKAFVGDMQITTAQRTYAVASEANRPVYSNKKEMTNEDMTQYGRIEDAAERGASKAISNAKVEMNGKQVGKMVTPYVREEMGKANERRT